MAWQKFKVEIPPEIKLSPVQRTDLADLIIEHIFERTNNGVDKNGNKFPRYSKEYIASLNFKVAGKSKNKVDLQLSGDMLAGIKLINQKKDQILIGFENGTPENGKAEGNIKGTYGQKSPIPGKKRDFLGIEAKKLKELLEHVTDDK